MGKDIILETKDLKKHFKIKGGKVLKAVDGVSIQVEERPLDWQENPAAESQRLGGP